MKSKKRKGGPEFAEEFAVAEWIADVKSAPKTQNAAPKTDGVQMMDSTQQDSSSWADAYEDFFRRS